MSRCDNENPHRPHGYWLSHPDWPEDETAEATLMKCEGVTDEVLLVEENRDAE